MLFYNVIISKRAIKELNKIPRELKILFLKHIKKLENHLPGKHLEHSKYFVEKVTDSARIVCEIEQNNIKIVRCFANHKDYEKWYKSF